MEENLSCIRVFADQQQIRQCQERLKAAESSFGQVAQVLNLAGNEARLKMLFLLQEEGELCVCDLSDILKMTIPAVSQHLRKLKDANLIQFRKAGQTIFYSLKKDHLGILRPLLAHLSTNNLEQIAL